MKMLSSFLALVVLGGCGPEPRRCTFSVSSGVLNVRIRDARTKAPICDANVFANETNNAERFELAVDANCVYSRNSLHIDGVYEIDVGHPQYELAARDGVTLRPAEGECHSFANVEIELEPKAR